MATDDTELPDLTAASALDGTESYYLVQGGNSRKDTIAGRLKTYLETLFQPLAAILTAIAALASSGLIARTGSGTVAARSIAVTASSGLSVSNGDGVSGNPTLAGVDATTSAKGVSEFATAAEYRTGTDTARSLVVDQVWSAAASVSLSSSSNVTAVSLSALLTMAHCALGENSTIAFSNLKVGQHFSLWFTATGSTRTLTMDANAKLWTGVETGPYSITTSQSLFVCGFISNGSVIEITAIGRRST